MARNQAPTVDLGRWFPGRPVSRKGPPDPRRAKIHHSYTIAEVARLYGVHRNTVRAWTRAGLETISAGRELLILGDELRRFLTARRADRRVKTPAGSIYCFGCRAPRKPAEGMVEVLNPSGPTVNLRALCAECGSLMHRRVSLKGVGEAGFGNCVTQADSHLADSSHPSVNCHSNEDA